MCAGSTNVPPPHSGSSKPSSGAISETLAALWQKGRPEVVADLQQLIVLLSGLDGQTATATGIADATALAHRLHGAFGVFGWTALKDDLGTVEQSLVSGETAFIDLISTIQRVLASLP